MLPQFNESGLLPAGIHPCNWSELRERFGYNYSRGLILEGLAKGVKMLQMFGNPWVYVGGSFVASKEIPGDFDACWTYENLTSQIVENLLGAYPVFMDLEHPRALQKMAFRGEFFPAFAIEGGSGKTFLDFFQQDKETGLPKGIIHLIL